MSKAKKRTSAESEDELDSDADDVQDKQGKRSSSKKKQMMDEFLDNEPPSLERNVLDFKYSDLHRAVLQYIMSKKYVEESALAAVSETLGRSPKISVAKLVQEINTKLTSEDLHMQIRLRQMVEDEDKPKVYGLVSTRSDAIAKEATSLEPWKLVLFNSFLELLATSSDGSASETEIWNKYNTVPNFQSKTYADVRQTLKKLMSLGWLKETKKNFYTAGPRTMLELSDVLREYGAQECAVSKQIVLPTAHYKKWLEVMGQ